MTHPIDCPQKTVGFHIEQISHTDHLEISGHHFRHSLTVYKQFRQRMSQSHNTAGENDQQTSAPKQSRFTVYPRAITASGPYTLTHNRCQNHLKGHRWIEEKKLQLPSHAIRRQGGHPKTADYRSKHTGADGRNTLLKRRWKAF